MVLSSLRRCVQTEGRGWGLYLKADVKADDLIVEYCGEVLSAKQLEDRLNHAALTGETNFYMFSVPSPPLFSCLFVQTWKKFESDFVLCRSTKAQCWMHNRWVTTHASSITAVNPIASHNSGLLLLRLSGSHIHSPDTCTRWLWWCVDRTVGGQTRVGIYAKRDIPANTELTYDYNFQAFWAPGKEQKCLCGADNCSGTLGKRPKKQIAAAKSKQSNSKAKGKSKSPAKAKGKGKAKSSKSKSKSDETESEGESEEKPKQQAKASDDETESDDARPLSAAKASPKPQPQAKKKSPAKARAKKAAAASEDADRTDTESEAESVATPSKRKRKPSKKYVDPALLELAGDLVSGPISSACMCPYGRAAANQTDDAQEEEEASAPKRKRSKRAADSS